MSKNTPPITDDTNDSLIRLTDLIITNCKAMLMLIERVEQLEQQHKDNKTNDTPTK